MKKIGLFFLTTLFVLSILSGCGESGGNPGASSGESETAGELTEEAMSPKAYKPDHYYMSDLYDANCIKLLGRTTVTSHDLRTDWSGTGIAFRVHTDGEMMQVGFYSSYETYFSVRVDDQEILRAPVNAKGSMKINLSAGDHDISIAKENEIAIEPNSYCHLTEISFKGSFYARPEDKAMFIECIGDSIVAGDGCLGTYDGNLWKKTDHSAYASFAAVCSRMLDADYSLVCRGGIGVLKARDERNMPMPAIYNYVAPYSDLTTEYSFERKPDMIIFKLGTNDSEFPDEEYYQAMSSFLDQIWEKNGSDVPIVWTGNSTKQSSANRYKEEHPDKKFFVHNFTYGNSGAAGSQGGTSGHPNVAEQLAYGEDLYQFVRLNVLKDVAP